MRQPLLATGFLLLTLCCAAQHPIAFAPAAEWQAVRKALPQYPVLQQSFAAAKKEVDPWLSKEVDVPVPKDPAGGYTHERHKANYGLLFNAGILYNLTGDKRYAQLVKMVLLKYAALNPTLKKHPEATSSSPGHIFWQALNDANWLVYAALGYDAVKAALEPADRTKIETGAFKPEVDYFTKDLKDWFNLIHNHGVWACAGVGITGIATDNDEWVQMALYGTEKKGITSGYLSQLDGLFSPDGYYTEGPYYVRYALLPFYIFANALNNARPALKIFAYRGRILQKALLAALQQTNTDGAFYTFNDGMKDKDYTASELVTAVDIAWKVYGKQEGLLTVAAKQNRVLLNGGGALVAGALQQAGAPLPPYPYLSVHYTDGAKGDEGGISILRQGAGNGLTSLLFKYSAHGLSHGHFDKLGLMLYDKGAEILQDYGSVRFVGVEQKYGGRYLKENDAFAMQTIAHNTLVADEQSHYGGREKEAEKYHAEKVFSSTDRAGVQAVSARDEHAYGTIRMQRTLYLLQLQDGAVKRQLIVDLFHAAAPGEHQYDLPFQYKGQVIGTSFKYKAATASQEPLGKANGYQYYWKEAVAKAGDSLSQFTFLNGTTFYTISSLTTATDSLFLVRAGAHDPNFNLRPDPAYIIRRRGATTLFASVIEIHGGYDPINEVASDAHAAVQSIQLLQDDGEQTVVMIKIGGKDLLVAQSNYGAAAGATHSFAKGISLQWTGPFTVVFDYKKL